MSVEQLIAEGLGSICDRCHYRVRCRSRCRYRSTSPESGWIYRPFSGSDSTRLQPMRSMQPWTCKKSTICCVSSSKPTRYRRKRLRRRGAIEIPDSSGGAASKQQDGAKYWIFSWSLDTTVHPHQSARKNPARFQARPSLNLHSGFNLCLCLNLHRG